MLCKNCGKQLEEGLAFCTTCGARVENDEVAAEQENIQETYQEESVPEYEGAVATEEALEVEETEEAQPEFCTNCGAVIEEGCEFCVACGEKVSEASSGGKLSAVKSFFKNKVFRVKTAVIAVAIIVAANVVGWAYPYAENALMKAVLPSEKYLGYVVNKNIKNGLDGISDAWDVIRNIFADGVSLKQTTKVEKGDGFDKLLNDMGAGEVADGIDWFKNATVSGKLAVRDSVLAADVDLKINKVDFGKLSLDWDWDAGKIYFGASDFNSKQIKADVPAFDSEQINRIMQALPNGSKAEKILTKYISCVTKSMADGSADVSGHTIEAQGISQNVTKITVTINEENVKNVASAVLEELKKDKDIKKIVEEVADAADVEAPDYEEAINEAIDALDKWNPGEFEFSFDVYVNSKGEIVGYYAAIGEDMEMKQIIAMDGSDIGMESTVKMNVAMPQGSIPLTVAFEGTGRQNFGKCSGNFVYAIKYAGINIDIFDAEVKNMDLKKAQKGVFDGSMNIRISDGIKQIAKLAGGNVNINIPEALFDLSINVKSSNSLFNTKEEATLMYGNEPCIKVTSTSDIGGSGKIKLPTKYVDGTDNDEAGDWAEEFKTDKLIKKLEKAGFPDEAVESVEKTIDRMQ